MESKAENIVQNIGAIAETVSIFYNSISKQVPKDVALVLTQHFMDLTINHRPATGVVLSKNVASAIAAAQAAEAKRRAEQKKQQEAQEKAKEKEAEPQTQQTPEEPQEE